MSDIKNARDDAKTLIDALSAVTARSVTATVAWVPETDRKDITGLEIIVSAPNREIAIAGRRGQSIDDVTVSVSIREPLGDDPDGVAEGVNLISEAISKELLAAKLATSGARIEGATVVPMNADDWREKRLAHSVVELTARIVN